MELDLAMLMDLSYIKWYREVRDQEYNGDGLSFITNALQKGINL